MRIYVVTQNNVDGKYYVVENRGTPTPMGVGDTPAEAVASAYEYLIGFDDDFCITPHKENFEIKTCKPAGNSSHIRTPNDWIGSEVYVAKYTGD